MGKKGTFFSFLFLCVVTLGPAPMVPISHSLALLYAQCIFVVSVGGTRNLQRRMRVEISPVEEEETASSLFVVCLSIQWKKKPLKKKGQIPILYVGMAVVRSEFFFTWTKMAIRLFSSSSSFQIRLRSFFFLEIKDASEVS
jgi:hypothetical protein